VPELDYVRWLRQRVGHAKVILVYASAVISDGRGHILLQQRSDFPWWGLPGGVLERGERLADCLAREVREETGLEVQPERLTGVYSSPEFDVVYPNGDQVQQFTVCFACRVTGGTLHPDGDEVLKLRYFPPRDLPQVPSWYRAMIEDHVGGAGCASFRSGAAGGPMSSEYTLWLRQFVGTEPIVIVGASGWVRDQGGRVLLVRRADDRSWGIPAGAMELGERVDQTLVREVEEESGLRVEPRRLLGVYSGPELFLTYPNGDRAYVVASSFDCRIVGGEPRPDGRETVEVRFFPVDRLPPLPARHRIRVEDALSNPEATLWR
jgi:ADP-ribose pyrophosphatase YjhB (NUDIX family)